MATGRYLSLEEARKKKQLDRFSKENPSKGDEKKFDALLGAMTKPKSSTKDAET